jgi:hypothetical protein
MKYGTYHCNSASKNEIAFRLVLSAGRLNLPLVPSQDYVLQDNKELLRQNF